MSNEYVYPFQEFGLNGFGEQIIVEQSQGLTKREYFALHIYCAEISSGSDNVKRAVREADLLLAELDKKP